MIPKQIRLYHIVHTDRLPSIMDTGFLWCDRQVRDRALPGTTIGMSRIKDRRLLAKLVSHPTLAVGSCVPFYFSARSEMLFMIHKGNHDDIEYKDGQEKIVHLVFDIHDAIGWANAENLRWAFTLSGAGSGYFEDRADLRQLDEIDWAAVKTDKWSGAGIDSDVRDKKKAEFLIECRIPWSLVRGIGVCNDRIGKHVAQVIATSDHRPPVRSFPRWYY